MDPIKYVFEKPILSGRISRWFMQLSEYDIKYVTQKSIKGRVIADHLADFLIYDELKDEPLRDECVMSITRDVWELYFDGSVNKRGQGIGILLVTPTGDGIPFSVKLEYAVTNNVAEYEACIFCLQVALKFKVKKLNVFSDSNLLVSQMVGGWRCDEKNLLFHYHTHLEGLTSKFDEVRFFHIPRENNKFADALAVMGAYVGIPNGIMIRSVEIRTSCKPAYLCPEINTGEELTEIDLWYMDIKNLLQSDVYPTDASKQDRVTLRRWAANYTLCGDSLYKTCSDGIQCFCVSI